MDDGAIKIGLIDRDILDIFTTFNPLGYWRVELDTGHTYGCDRFSEFFGLSQTDGPINMVELSSHIHPEDLSSVMEIHEAASVKPMAYQKVHRVTNDGKTYRYVCSIGRFRMKPGTSGEIVGITYALPPQRCEYKSVPDDTGT